MIKNKKDNAFSHFKKNPKLLKCKKAQEDSTITWIVAIFIIVLILMFYLIITFSMSVKNSLNWNGEVNSNGVSYLQDLGSSQTLFSVLNSEIQFNGKNTKIMNAILDSFDAYFETKNSEGYSLVEKYGLDNYDDISRTTKSKMITDGFKEESVDKINAQNQNLADEIRKILDLYCWKYRLAIPQGMISEEGLQSSDSLGNRIYFNLGKGDPFPVDWTPTAGFILKYRRAKTSIKFTELIECSQLTKIGGRKNES